LQQSRALAFKARLSWLFPVIAWGSQFVFALTLRGVRGLALFWLTVMLAQGALIILGLYFGAKVLAAGSSVAPPTRRAAMTGLVLSVGTILLIVGLSIAG
jgi:hypothetical protein